MTIETHEDAIAAWDEGRENVEYVEDTTVSTCTGCTTSCPEAPDITINNSVMSLDGADAAIVTEHFADHTGTVTVSQEPADGYTPTVYRGGILQPVEDTHWSRVGKIFTFLPAPGLVGEDVTIEYAYEVVA